MDFLGIALFYIVIGLISIVPFFILYLLSDLTRFVVSKLVGYRKAVIVSNLKMAFPDKSEKEIKILTKRVYMNLADVLLEGLKTFTISKKNTVKRHKIINPELIEELANKNKSIIVATAHYNNWEWGSLSAGLQTNYNIAAFYKPIKNKRIDTFIRKSRSRCGTDLISIYKTSETFEKNKGKNYIYLMAADQSPSGRQIKHALWFNFLGLKTPFLHGVEKHARNNNHAVIYVDIQRVKRGYYELELSMLCENPSELKQGEITERYVRKVEEVILKKPENWLWSHKRWKFMDRAV